jgi:hypothetical protein
MTSWSGAWRRGGDFSVPGWNLVYNKGVSLLTADLCTAATVEYCRRARKIRASFDDNAFLRHEALTTLARERADQLAADREAARSRELPRVLAQPVTVRRRLASEQVERDFADQIAAKLQPFGFTFSDRLKLLNQAERLGINRFRANVMLAMHEHQANREQVAAANVKPKIPSLFAVLMAELAVVGALVWLFCC